MSPVIAALIGTDDRDSYIPQYRYSKDEWERRIARYREMQHTENAAKDAIYRAAGRWTGVDIVVGDRLPVMREGRVISWMDTFMSTSLVNSVLRSGKLAPTSNLKGERRHLKSLLDALLEAKAAINGVHIDNVYTLDRTWSNHDRGRSDPVDLVHAIGLTDALSISIHGVVHNIRVRLEEIEKEMADIPEGRGRPRNRPEHAAAKSFAELYAAILGTAPTCSFSDGIYSGKFAPMLRDLFDAFGWKNTDIRGPGDAAVATITEDYIRAQEAARIARSGGIFGLRE